MTGDGQPGGRCRSSEQYKAVAVKSQHICDSPAFLNQTVVIKLLRSDFTGGISDENQRTQCACRYG